MGELDNEKPGNEGLDTAEGIPDNISTNDKKTAEDQPGYDKPIEEEYPTGIRFFFIVVALCFAFFLCALDMSIVATAIPKITDEFGGLELVAWYGSAFFMCVGGLQPTWGKVYKYFPLKWTFLLTVFIFEIGSLICAVSPSGVVLVVGRVVAGIGASGVVSGTYTLIAFAAPPSRRPLLTGIVGASYGLASVAGPLVGGVFSDKVTWRWCFYVNLPIGGVCAAIIWLFFHAPEASKPAQATLREKLLNIDLFGLVLLMSATVCYILVMQYGGQTHPWLSSVVIGLLIGFCLILAAFITWEIFQGERATIPPRLFRKRSVWVMGMFGLFFGGAYFSLVYYLPLYFQSINGVTPIVSGVHNLPLILSVTVGTIMAGGIITATGMALPFMIGAGILATIGAGLIYMLDQDTSVGRWIGYQIFAGFSYGFGLQIPMIIAQADAPASDLSSVTSITLSLQLLGGAYLVSASQAAFVNTMSGKLASVAPGVTSAQVTAAGAAELRHVFGPEVLQGVLKAYMSGLKVTFALAIAATGISSLIACMGNWKRIDPDVMKKGGGVMA